MPTKCIQGPSSKRPKTRVSFVFSSWVTFTNSGLNSGHVLLVWFVGSHNPLGRLRANKLGQCLKAIQHADTGRSVHLTCLCYNADY
ncbi:BnaC04g01880D [Brassica napus]|uniref:BnaC04g01880D protein n=1 Tax=Brassica napus TaxID=3708 RepID=A0A078GEU3_BRANA|nr:BnaC04g01880D [Brassica napus]